MYWDHEKKLEVNLASLAQEVSGSLDSLGQLSNLGAIVDKLNGIDAKLATTSDVQMLTSALSALTAGMSDFANRAEETLKHVLKSDAVQAVYSENQTLAQMLVEKEDHIRALEALVGKYSERYGAPPDDSGAPEVADGSVPAAVPGSAEVRGPGNAVPGEGVGAGAEGLHRGAGEGSGETPHDERGWEPD
jgi:hypothetical protein